MKRKPFLKLIISILIPFAVAAIGGFFTSSGMDWYATLNRPSFNPPGPLFGPVWTVLYLLLGLSLFLVWMQRPSGQRKRALLIFGIQMILNFGWTFLFFYFHRINLAFLEIILLLLCIIFMLYAFYKVRPLAAFLNIPYLLWVGFATVLTGSYYLLN